MKVNGKAIALMSVFLVLFMVSSTLAETNSTVVSGKVYDSVGNQVAGAEVGAMCNGATSGSVIANAIGEYLIRFDAGICPENSIVDVFTSNGDIYGANSGEVSSCSNYPDEELCSAETSNVGVINIRLGEDNRNGAGGKLTEVNMWADVNFTDIFGDANLGLREWAALHQNDGNQGNNTEQEQVTPSVQDQSEPSITGGVIGTLGTGGIIAVILVIIAIVIVSFAIRARRARQLTSV
jgi:hypothetical protein